MPRAPSTSGRPQASGRIDDVTSASHPAYSCTCPVDACQPYGKPSLVDTFAVSPASSTLVTLAAFLCHASSGAVGWRTSYKALMPFDVPKRTLVSSASNAHMRATSLHHGCGGTRAPHAAWGAVRVSQPQRRPPTGPAPSRPCRSSGKDAAAPRTAKAFTPSCTSHRAWVTWCPTSQTRTVPSLLPVATSRPRPNMALSFTARVCPSSTRGQVPSSADTMRARISTDVDSTTCALGKNRTLVTSLACPSHVSSSLPKRSWAHLPVCRPPRARPPGRRARRLRWWRA